MKTRLQEYLKRHGYVSTNRDAKKLVRDQIVLVNGVRVKSVSIKVNVEKSSSVQVIIDGEQQQSATIDHDDSSSLLLGSNVPQEQSFCIAFHKPCGMICTLAPPSNNNSSISSSICATPQPETATPTTTTTAATTLRDIQPPMPENFRNVGRLDQHSHGLLLFSWDGRLTSALISPKTGVERIYRLVVKGDVGAKGSGGCSDNDNGAGRYETICNTVEKGVETDYGFFQGRILHMERDVCHDYAHATCGVEGGKRTDRFDDQGNNNLQSEDEENKCILSSITVAVKEGKNRMVRRLFAAIGLFVLDLQRIKYGDVELGDLAPGEWRFLVNQNLKYCRDVMQQWEDGGAGWEKE